MADKQPVVRERRAGERVPSSIPVRLRRIGNQQPSTAKATIVDVSVSGARLVATTVLGLDVGDQVELDYSAVKTLAVVRRYEVDDVRGRGFYGVEFTECDEAFRALVFRVVSAATRRV